MISDCNHPAPSQVLGEHYLNKTERKHGETKIMTHAFVSNIDISEKFREKVDTYNFLYIGLHH